MVSLLSEDIVGAVLTAPSREQCWLSLPHQRVQQVPLFFLRKALVLGTWFLVKYSYVQSVQLMSQPAAYLAAPFQVS